MTIEAISQAAKTIIESSYDYETALQDNDFVRAEQSKRYMLKICESIKRLVEEEKKNV